MSIEQWWPKLEPATQQWLIEHNGEPVPAEIVVEVTAAGGFIASGRWWQGQVGPSGFFVSDEAVDWIEEIANGESPASAGPI